MEKIIRIIDQYGVKKEVNIDAKVDIRKGESVYCDYNTYTVTQVLHYIEDNITYYICE